MSSKRNKAAVIEDKFGKPLKEVLIEMYHRHGKQIEVARALGVTQSTVSIWVAMSDLSVRQVLVEKKEVE